MAKLDEKIALGKLSEEERKKAEELGLITPDKDKLFEEAVSTGKKRDYLKDDLKKRQEMTGWLEIADELAQNLTKYAAARRGADTGVDMSNIKIEGTDWDKMRERADKSYERETKELSDREKAIAEMLGRKEKEDPLALYEGKKILDKKYTEKAEKKGLEVAKGVLDAETKLPVFLNPTGPGYIDAYKKPIPNDRTISELEYKAELGIQREQTKQEGIRGTVTHKEELYRQRFAGDGIDPKTGRRYFRTKDGNWYYTGPDGERLPKDPNVAVVRKGELRYEKDAQGTKILDMAGNPVGYIPLDAKGQKITKIKPYSSD